ncbi:MAG TPA: efflux RND transporter periplasmic adaptor subunit [Alcanivorax sp.]|jgi:membrane fusion protein, multidrug efflux system|uniref:efflux RND transporter periplasmic adaptor subunit n=1 Tax=Alloalcanivorax venustensis TaxID=172371 RepID=UPI0007941FE7|nr:MAG: efflux transporter periplasmic adaptor subunit [Alcanivorax sp. Nap_24]MCH2551753.1 efflux RND transporter periplasmic adaptor subunit [Alcanivorax sp.]MEA3261832.1 efflux RND transporter periplasmic adaptor subunit [Pseudomonadota bacterium]HAB06831.1 efflux RND transporter periplasmic adaptor subunit [Alcanivorax sp.]HBP69213.1 efflux RND transporter periplasmic adaptor subunit [Alcanivorax sp.]|tara:strand:+ start:1021 stop:2151 length:1131 start_codon:yes stop_codon:yes gene_type:complete
MSRYPLLALLPLALVMAACSPAEPESDTSPRPALVVQPGTGDALRDIYPGEVRARYEPELAFRIGGKISRRMVTVGDRVEAGQPLAELNAEDVRLELDAARARLASARSDQRLARSELERYRTLLERQVISQSQFDSVESRAEASDAQLEQARAQLKVAGNQADYAVLEAPETGVIAQRLAEAGQVVAAGQAVFVLAVDGDREVVIDLPEQDVKRFQVGDEVAIELWSRPGEPFPGRIRELAPAADPSSRTFEARVAFDNDTADANLGQSARVLVDHANGGADVLTVPLAAVTADQGESFVWVVNPDDATLVKTPVRTGAYREDRVPVLEGLSADDWVVAAGTQVLREGQKVRPVDRQNRQVSLGDGQDGGQEGGE